MIHSSSVIIYKTAPSVPVSIQSARGIFPIGASGPLGIAGGAVGEILGAIEGELLPDPAGAVGVVEPVPGPLPFFLAFHSLTSTDTTSTAFWSWLSTPFSQSSGV